MITVSYSELDAYRQCPFKHRLAYKERWSKPSQPDSALAKGSLFHSVLEAHYKRIMWWQQDSPDNWYSYAEKALNTHMPHLFRDMDVDDDMRSLMQWMYDGYVFSYSLDPTWKIRSVEHSAIVPFFNEDGTEATDFNLKVKLDLVVVDHNNREWIVDHKTGANLPADKDLDFDDQFGLYTYAMQKLGHPTLGTIHNAMRTTRNQGDILKPGDAGYKKSMKEQTLEERFKRTYMRRTNAELKMIQADALADARLMYSEHNHGGRHANPDTCKWRCGFKEACIAGRRVGSDNRTFEILEDTGFTREYNRN